MRPENTHLAKTIQEITSYLSEEHSEEDLLAHIGRLTRELVSTDDWLDPVFAQPDERHYQQYLLHADPEGRFSIVSFVWGPGQETPIHNHTVWGVIGMLRGAEIEQRYRLDATGRPVADGPPQRLEPGDVAFVSPRIGDIHVVRNAFPDRSSISIHIYGADIGRTPRSVYLRDGEEKRFISGYATPSGG